MKVYTIRDIAKAAGVSVTTVSRVLNHRPDVNAATREKVERVMAEHHFVGNANARGLKQVDSDVVAIILRGHQNPFLNALAEAMLAHTQDTKYSFVLEFIDEKADEFQTALRLSQEKRAKGFIFAGSRIDERSRVLSRLDTPIVFATANAGGSDLLTASTVTVDERAMGRLAMDTLLDKGHRKIAIFGGSRSIGDNLALRYEGAAEALAARGLTFDEDRYVETRFSLQGGYDSAKELFARKPDTTAVFTMSDTMAMGAIRALEDMGLRVPDDVSVMGFDGIEMGKYYKPRITTIEQPVQEIARSSVEVLLDMLDNAAAPRHVLVNAVLHMRDSVG